MIAFLPDNPQHVQALCDQLQLGAPTGELSRVYGGFHHSMWRLDTARGTYAVKQLADDTDLSGDGYANHFNVCEGIAAAFAERDIPAVVALNAGEGYLQVLDDCGYLVYPWCDAKALDKDTFSEEHAYIVARLLARMHLADIEFPELGEEPVEVLSAGKIQELMQLAGDRQIPNEKLLLEQLPLIMAAAEKFPAAVERLSRYSVISHGDLDRKNVLWSAAGEPCIIDWECVRRLNPTYEIVLEALDWSGITDAFKPRFFAKIIGVYQQAGGVIEPELLEASFHCIMGEWVEWLMYNVGRTVYLEDLRMRALGAEQVAFVMRTLMRLKQLMPILLTIANEQAVTPPRNAYGGSSNASF